MRATLLVVAALLALAALAGEGAKPELSRSDWTEIYFAVKYKLERSEVVDGYDPVSVAWRAQLTSILQRLDKYRANDDDNDVRRFREGL